MHYIEPQVAGACDSQQRVQVGAIAVNKTASLVNDFIYFDHIFIE